MHRPRRRQTKDIESDEVVGRTDLSDFKYGIFSGNMPADQKKKLNIGVAVIGRANLPGSKEGTLPSKISADQKKQLKIRGGRLFERSNLSGSKGIFSGNLSVLGGAILLAIVFFLKAVVSSKDDGGGPHVGHPANNLVINEGNSESIRANAKMMAHAKSGISKESMVSDGVTQNPTVVGVNGVPAVVGHSAFTEVVNEGNVESVRASIQIPRVVCPL